MGKCSFLDTSDILPVRLLIKINRISFSTNNTTYIIEFYFNSRWTGFFVLLFVFFSFRGSSKNSELESDPQK